jgi:alpha-galactosidase
MKSQNHLLRSLVLLSIFAMVTFASVVAQTTPKRTSPLLGWNSYNCYGIHINEKQTWENLEAFIYKLKPSGYEFFVIDAGWYQIYNLKPNQLWPMDGDKRELEIDAFGRFIPSRTYFPNGFKAIVDHAKKHNVKFGLHMMRGIPRVAVEKNLPIKGTKYFARDIANVSDTCSWSTLMYGIDMNKPGAQEYYNSVVELMSSWGVEFIKYDDIVHKPQEIEAVVKAINKNAKRIYLSISPGDDIDPKYYDTYKKADMIRISRDIWDLKEDIEISFHQWDSLKNYANKGFWLDMDMIPFGHIRIDYPVSRNKLQAKRGYERMDYFSYAQKKSFITQRAMAASPLFMGGALTTSPNIVFELITNNDMLACNQNGITGSLVTRISDYGSKIDVWKTPHRTNKNEGWIGVFNRNSYMDIVKFNKSELGLETAFEYQFYDIWGKRVIENSETIVFEIPADDVVFIKYKSND